jgi:hypothetical protein
LQAVLRDVEGALFANQKRHIRTALMQPSAEITAGTTGAEYKYFH